MTNVEIARRRVHDGYYDREEVIDATVEEIVREEFAREGEPLVRVGQGDFARETDDPFDEVGRSSLCGGLEIVGWAVLVGVVVLAGSAWRFFT